MLQYKALRGILWRGLSHTYGKGKVRPPPPRFRKEKTNYAESNELMIPKETLGQRIFPQHQSVDLSCLSRMD